MLFIADKEPNTIWRGNYYLAGMRLGKYSLVDGKVMIRIPRMYDENTHSKYTKHKSKQVSK